MEEKDIYDKLAYIANDLVIGVRNELSQSEAVQVVYAKLVWAYFEGKNEAIPSIRKNDKI